MMAGRAYAEIFPVGCRVRVKAGYMEGTDRHWNGHQGTVVSHGHWIGVRMDQGERGWPKAPIMICGHNLVALPSPPSKEGE